MNLKKYNMYNIGPNKCLYNLCKVLIFELIKKVDVKCVICQNFN